MKITQETLKILANTAAKRIQDRINKGGVKPGTSKSNGKKTLLESGKLKNSIRYRVSGQKIVISAGGAGMPYAAIQHTGGVIKPRRAKYLAIPLNSIAKAKSPRDFKKTFIRKGIIYLEGDNGVVTPMYVLKKSVTIPARPYMFLTEEDKKIVYRTLNKELQRNGLQKNN
jgi:phage gpG-like protein